MPNAGHILNVLVCSTQPPGAGAGQVFGPVDSTLCPQGTQAYLVESYVPFSSSQTFIDGLMSPFDTAVASGIFGFAFGIVVFFWLLGLKGSVILKPFWGGYR